MIRDIEISLAAGFNGARLHQKVFEPRFLYHCDRLGYIVWGEHGNWGMNYENVYAAENFTCEWMEIIRRDFNHPAIIGWCPFNETWGYDEANKKSRLIEMNYKLTKILDPTRPCIDTSWNYHVITDIYDTHNYESKIEIFQEQIAKLDREGVLYDSLDQGNKYNGEPTFVSEYGGIRWVSEERDGWGYGEMPETEEEFFARYKGLTEALLNSKRRFGFCYTQLYDVEQEINGLYTYERIPKFDMEIIRKINVQIAAIEKEI